MGVKVAVERAQTGESMRVRGHYPPAVFQAQPRGMRPAARVQDDAAEQEQRHGHSQQRHRDSSGKSGMQILVQRGYERTHGRRLALHDMRVGCACRALRGGDAAVNTPDRQDGASAVVAQG